MSGPWDKYQSAGPWTKYAEPPVDPTSSFGENVAAGAGKAMFDLYRGGKKLAAKVGFGDEKQVQAEIDEARRLDAPLASTAGGITGSVLGLLPAALIPGANTYAGASTVGAFLGALQPTAKDESIAANTAMGGAFGAGGKYLAGKIGDLVKGRLASETATKSAEAASNAPRDATLTAARKAGYVVPPTQANPSSAWNQLLESFSGKIKTGQMASAKNQDVTNRLAKEAIGLPADQPLTPQTLQAVRDQAGGAYRAVEGLQQIAPDDSFARAVDGLSRNRMGGATSNPADEAIDKLIGELKAFPQWDGKTLIADIKNLREMAKANFGAAERAGGDVAKNSLAKAQRDAADVLEDLAERNLNFNNAPGNLIEEFRNARQLIAKTYSIENALNESTGNVIGSKLASQLSKGKPMSGSLETAASFARAFPKAAQEVEKSGNLLGSPLDWAAMGTIGALVQNPAVLAGVAARPTIRSMILSGPYQSAMARPDYTVGMLTRGSQALADPRLQRLLPQAAVGGGFAYGE